MARYIVKLRSGALPDDILQSSDELSMSAIKMYPLYERDVDSLENQVQDGVQDDRQREINDIREKLNRTYIVEVNDATARETVVMLSGDDNIESIEPDEEVEEHMPVGSASLPPNDTLWSSLYGLKKLECESAWTSHTGDNVLVAVVDSGIDVAHEDLFVNVWNNGGIHGFNEIDGTNNIADDTSHGTHVSGTIGAILNNGLGVVGVAPHCILMGVRGLKDGKGALSTLLRCIRKAVDSGAKVINNSWGPGNRAVPDTDLVLRYAYLHNVNVVFSAGNNGRLINSSQIATHPNVICVASVDAADTRSSFSNFGPEVTLAAPGSIIWSTIPGDKWGQKSGTSMAAPHVTGVIALLLSKNSRLTPDEIKDILVSSADPLSDPGLGAGRVNARKALAMCPSIIV